MGIMDFFNAKKIKNENERLTKIVDDFKGLDLADIERAIDEKKKELEKIENKKAKANKNLMNINFEYEQMRGRLIEVEEDIAMESFALYKPRYNFITSEEYKNRISVIRDNQKGLVKAKRAATGNMNWTVNNNKAKGNKMVNDMIKLVLRAFNNECDAAVAKVKFNNIETCEKKMNSSFDALNKLGMIMDVRISNEYRSLKFEELYLVHEYQMKKQEEKEEQKRQREELREQKRLEKEIENQKKKIEKEEKHYNNELDKLQKQIEKCESDEEKKALMDKLDNVKETLGEIQKQMEDVDYRAANQRAGYVYVISNIGSFGENVYKIGMTRRLDPMDRVHELGDASVPFNFDVHAMIFSEDAPTLENKLHKAFEKNKVNMINGRREFFNVKLQDIENEVRNNFDKTVEFIYTPEAQQFRESIKLKEIEV